jgi:uncharacterized protein YcbX
MHSRKHALRILEHGNIQATIVGPSTRCTLYIRSKDEPTSKPYQTNIHTLRQARTIFDNYVRSNENGKQ